MGVTEKYQIKSASNHTSFVMPDLIRLPRTSDHGASRNNRAMTICVGGPIQDIFRHLQSASIEAKLPLYDFVRLYACRHRKIKFLCQMMTLAADIKNS
jgi:hypothetical protein